MKHKNWDRPINTQLPGRILLIDKRVFLNLFN